MRNLLRRAGHAAVGAGCLVDPTPGLARVRARRRAFPGARLATVYRRRNEDVVAAMVGDALAAGMDVDLWALDEPAPALAGHTRGCGPGGRYELLNRLTGDPDGRWTVLADDDVEFRHGHVADLVRLAAALRLDVSQPAHEYGSHASFWFTRRQPFRVARLTTLVEIGPVVAFSPRAARRLFPLPAEGMGWGVELGWLPLLDEGFRFGVVDAVSLRHLGPVGAAYPLGEESARMSEALAALGARGYSDLARTVEHVWFWRRPR